MPAINSRDNLLAWLRKRVVYRSVRRQIDNGECEVLGGFSKIPPYFSPGWIVLIRFVNRHGGKIRLFAILADGKIEELESIPWEYWCGEGRRNTVYCGDAPGHYREWCKKLKEKNNDNNVTERRKR